jgi:predicted O-linked N-acetylglucosamine transferase (SPINDLY family)
MAQTPESPNGKIAQPVQLDAAAHAAEIAKAMCALDSGNTAVAIDICERLLTANAADAKAIQLFAVVLMRRGDLAGAIEMMRRAVDAAPGDAEMWRNFGAMLGQQGRGREAVDAFFRAIEIDQSDGATYAQLGMALEQIELPDEAEKVYRRGIDVAPDNAQNWKRLGDRLFEKKDLNGAIEATDRALDLKPDYVEALANLCHQLRQACDWLDLEQVDRKLDAQTADAIAAGRKCGEPPMLCLIRSPDPMRHLAIADATAKNLVQRVRTLSDEFPMEVRRRPRDRIRLGYVGATFHNHPDSHLCCGIFERHDRGRFDVNVYSFGPDDGSSFRRRIERGCDSFVDLRGAETADAARRIYQDEVDILIGVTGHTVGSRLNVCALRPAPVQIAYLDYPGTIGGGIFDYLIVDPVVAPDGHDAFFTETLIRMPHCYQANDGGQEIGALPSRADYRLPDGALVLASFVNNYKIDPALFDVWMRLLVDLPGAALWLLRSNDAAEANLRKEAAARGIDANRLIFDGKCAKPDHLARLALADLCLDTLLYNGHTTTSDALFAGVPVLTVEGTHFPGRVAASILHAIGAPELIAASLDEYQLLARRLATDDEMRLGIRSRIETNRHRWPLFDTDRYVRNLESGYEQAWQGFATGQTRRPIRIVDVKPMAAANVRP